MYAQTQTPIRGNYWYLLVTYLFRSAQIICEYNTRRSKNNKTKTDTSNFKHLQTLQTTNVIQLPPILH